MGWTQSSILAIGDSLLAWNAGRCESVVDHTSLQLGQRLERRAIGGSEVLGGPTPIPEQVPGGSWQQVVLVGGANDLKKADVCGEADAQAVLDELSDPEGQQGVMPALVDALLADGASVLLLGYHEIPASAWNGFGDCADELTALDARYAAIAASRPDVTFLDLGDTLGTGDVDLLDDDHIHPNPAGAQALGRVIAEALSEL